MSMYTTERTMLNVPFYGVGHDKTNDIDNRFS